MTFEQLHSAALSAYRAAAQELKNIRSAKLAKAGSSPGRAMLQAASVAKAAAATKGSGY